jgi:hypothetical protein
MAGPHHHERTATQTGESGNDGRGLVRGDIPGLSDMPLKCLHVTKSGKGEADVQT